MVNEVRLIDMNTLWQCETCFHHYPNGCDTYCDHGESYRPAADKLTVIDPESLRPKGRWVIEKRHTVSSNPYMDDNYHAHATCSECNFCIHSDNASFGYPKLNTTNYCPNCGADMRGEDDARKD